MSDKEKLAYFLRLLDDNFTLKTYAGIELTYEELHYLTEKLAKEIEYRERVQELELECAGWKEAVRFEDEKLECQNKLYREAIRKSLDELKYSDHFNAEVILSEALEELYE